MTEGHQGEHDQRDGTAERRDRVEVEECGEDDGRGGGDHDAHRGASADSVAHGRRELPGCSHLLGEAGGRVEPGVGRAGGGEQCGDGHQPVAGGAQHGFGRDRQGGAAGGDDLVDGEGSVDADGDRDVDDGGDAEREVDGLGELVGRVGQVLGGEGDDAEAEEGEEGQRHAGHDLAEGGVAGERQQGGVEVGQRRDREDAQDADHDDDDQGLGAGDHRGAEDVQGGHHQHDEDREGSDPVVVVGDRGAGVAAERDRDHGRDDRVDGEEHPGDDAGEVALSPAPDDVLEEAAGGRVPGTHLGEGVALQRGYPARQQERDPHRRSGHLPGRPQQREDARPDHRADPDERGLARRQGARGPRSPPGHPGRGRRRH